MINTYTITIRVNGIGREIYVSPVLLQSKEQFPIKSGTILICKLYFYDQLKDDHYKANLELEVIDEKFKSDRYVINYGQDFEKFYIGSFWVDFETKRYWQWEGKHNRLSEPEINALGESLFNPNAETRNITIFTPTRPSDINFS